MHIVLWIVLLGILLILAWRGWRLGLVRALLNSATLIVGGLLGWFMGGFAAELLSQWLPWRMVYTQLAVMLGFVLCLAFVVAILSGLLLKKTKDHESRFIRLFFGMGGAVVAILTGLLVFFAGVWLWPSSAATPAESEMVIETSPEAAPIGFTNSVEIIEKISLLSNDPHALERFMEYPGIQRIVTHPAIVDLTSNPEINEAALQKNYLAILSNPAVLKAVADPALASELKKIDLQKALDYALEKKKNTDPE